MVRERTGPGCASLTQATGNSDRLRQFDYRERHAGGVLGAQQNGFCFVGALAAAVRTAGPHLQFFQRIHTTTRVFADFAIGNSIADAYEHESILMAMRTIVNT